MTRHHEIGDEIEWLDHQAEPEPRWRPGRVAQIRIEVTTDTPGEWMSVPAGYVRSANSEVQ